MLALLLKNNDMMQLLVAVDFFSGICLRKF